MVSHRRGYSAVKGSSHRDADEEALQIALRESIKPDYLAEILRSEAKQRLLDVARTSVPQVNHKAISNEQLMEIHEQEDSGDEDDTDTRSNARVVKGSVTTDGLQKAEDEKTQVDPNANHTLLNFPDTLLINILQWLDEDTIGSCTCTCKRLLPMARSEVLFESICRRVFPTQNPRVAIAITRNKFGLRRFPTWFAMFHDRPRVRYNGFYWLKVTYYKKPELSMWTDIVPGTILKCIYYRYFAFQRDGTVLYGMLFKAPHEVETHMRDRRKGVCCGRFWVDKNEVVVTVPTNYNKVNFRLQITQLERGKNVKLILKEHFANSEPNGTGWINYYDTADEEFHYYRSLIL